MILAWIAINIACVTSLTARVLVNMIRVISHRELAYLERIGHRCL
jgi:hypothetical protein